MAATVPGQTPEKTTDDDLTGGRAGAVEAAAEATKDVPVGPKTAQLASDWFLDNESIEAESVASALVPMNVAPPGQPAHWVDFKVQVLSRERIKQIRDESTSRMPDGSEKSDDMEANLRMAVEALLDPPIRTDPAYRVVRGQTFIDPGDALKARLAHKPGLIDQLAGRIVEMSGYNSSDVKEVRAAGNS
jgi:hypothetical protein